MKVTILDSITRHNVELFKFLMQRMKQIQLRELAGRPMRAYVHRETGQISFDEVSEKRHWKVILIKWDVKSQKPLEVVECDEEGCFLLIDLKPEAIHRLAETIKTLNRLVFDPKLQAINLQAIANVEILEGSVGASAIEKTWFTIDRHEAEALLLNSPIGTYLFRRGEYADILEENLSRLSPGRVRCFTITYNEWDGKVSERIIVFKDNHEWMFYDDDPNLKNVCYLTLEALLESMGDRLRFALAA